MAYLAPIHRPSSVRHALKLNLLDPDEKCLVVAKAKRLEIYTLTPDGLILAYVRAVYGTITMLQKLRPSLSSTDHLFVGTDRHIYFTVSWNPVKKQLDTEKSYVDQSDKSGRDSQARDSCLIDPSRRYLTLSLFEGILTVIPIVQTTKRKGDPEVGTLGEPVPARIAELFIRSSAYLYPRSSSSNEKPKLVLLYDVSQQKPRLKVKTLKYTASGAGDPGTVDLEDSQPKIEVDIGASHLIPIPSPAYGFFILAETSITYFNEHSGYSAVEVLDEATLFVAWEQIDGQRWLLADDYGRLFFLMLLLDGSKVSGWKVDFLGLTSQASTMVYLDDGCVFVGSHQGDSQVIKLLEHTIEVIQTFSNLAPILDFAITDMGSRASEALTNEYSSGQARIVTGSGAFQDGSLRSVRSGVRLEDLGSLGEMEHITDLFALRSWAHGKEYDFLLVSFVNETRVFKFDAEGDIEEAEDFRGFSMTEATLFAITLSSNRLLQVTSSSVRITDAENGVVIADWRPSSSDAIIAASSDGFHLALSINGVDAIILSLFGELRVVAQHHYGSENQIACIEIPTVVQGVCIIGFWQSAVISFIDIRNFRTIQTTTVNGGADTISVPRSVLLTRILPEAPPTLFIGMADGNVVTYHVDPIHFTLSAKQSTILGTQQAIFKALPRENGTCSVLAMCEHPSLIYGSDGRIVYSAVTAENATCVCAFNTEAYPNAIAIAISGDLKIAVVDTERTTHVQTLEIGETVRRIAYSTNLRAFALGTVKRTLIDGIEIVQSHVKLADEVVFEELDTFDLNEDELVESLVRAEVMEEPGTSVERFLAGTAYLDDDHPDAVIGRIIVFEVTHDRTLKVVTEASVQGPCRVLSVMDGKIVAALEKTVVIYTFNSEKLVEVASYLTATVPVDLAVVGDIIAVADIMKSLAIIQYRQGTAGEPDSLVEIARHFSTAWCTAVAHIDDDTFLQSDGEGNLVVLHQNIDGVTADDRRRLEITSEMQLGEGVNRIQRVNVSGAPDAIVIPRAFIATVEGSIYLFALIHQDRQDLLMRLQSAIAKYVQSPGNIPFNNYRAFRSTVRHEDEPFRFVDGEIVEKFLECSTTLQDLIVEDLGVGVEDIKRVVEALRRLH